MNIHEINMPLSMFQGFENTWSKRCPKLIDLFALKPDKEKVGLKNFSKNSRSESNTQPRHSLPGNSSIVLTTRALRISPPPNKKKGNKVRN